MWFLIGLVDVIFTVMLNSSGKMNQLVLSNSVDKQGTVKSLHDA